MTTATCDRTTPPATTTIDEVDTISPRDFFTRYVSSNRPLLMHGMTRDWPATQKWSFEFFAQKSLDKEVFLEHDNVMQGDTQYARKTYGDALRAIIDSEPGSQKSAGYLSVFKIFRAFPELQADVDFSLLSQFQRKSTVAGWIGPAGTVTGYHIDWGDNLLAQMVGRKFIRLVAPADSKFMYPSDRFDQGTKGSQVDADKYDEARFPLYRQATVFEVFLHPGDMLFIPRGWWHYVKSLDKSISVSSIGYDTKGLFVDLLSHRLLQWLHDIGFYKVPCTCHVTCDGKRVRRAIAN